MNPLQPVAFCMKNILQLLIATLLAFLPLQATAQSLDQRLRPYVKNGSVLVATDHQVLYAHKAEELFIPASILKLATALIALQQFGKNHRYPTEFYLSEHNDLLVRGYGDPQLVSEEWQSVAKFLSAQPRFPKALNNLYLDASAFASPILIPGVENSLNPYDALNGALVANFNTIYVKISPKRQVHSAEKQTPLTPLAEQLAQGLAPGKHRINISRNAQETLPYVGELLQAFLQQEGITFSGKIKSRSLQKGDRLVHTHKNSHRLSQTIASMMQYSNNFIANQLFLTAGMAKLGMPATLESGVRVTEHYLAQQLLIPNAQFQVAEGSGISRKNRFTAHAVLKTLKAFRPYRSLLTKYQGARLKTGTLRGVYSLAGYLSEKPTTVYFVIILNQKKNYRDKILTILQKEFL